MKSLQYKIIIPLAIILVITNILIFSAALSGIKSSLYIKLWQESRRP